MNQREYNHQYYLKNKKRLRLKQNKKYEDPEWRAKTYKKHMEWYHSLPKAKKEKILKQFKVNGKRIRREIKLNIMKLCGKGKAACVVCGISDIDVLTIDHINGRKGEAKKSENKNNKYYGVSLWQKILKGELDKSEYQTLCMNCNWKRHVNRIRKVAS